MVDYISNFKKKQSRTEKFSRLPQLELERLFGDLFQVLDEDIKLQRVRHKTTIILFTRIIFTDDLRSGILSLPLLFGSLEKKIQQFKA